MREGGRVHGSFHLGDTSTKMFQNSHNDLPQLQVEMHYYYNNLGAFTFFLICLLGLWQEISQMLKDWNANDLRLCK